MAGQTYILGASDRVLDGSLGFDYALARALDGDVNDFAVYSPAVGPVHYLRNETIRRGLAWTWQLPGLGYLAPPPALYNALAGSTSMNQIGKDAMFLTILDEIARAGGNPYVVQRPGIIWNTAEHQTYLPNLSRTLGGNTTRVQEVWQWAWSNPAGVGMPNNLVNAVQVFQAAVTGHSSTHDPATGLPYNQAIQQSVPGLDQTFQQTTREGLATGTQLAQQQAQQYQPSPALQAAGGVGQKILGGIQNVTGALKSAMENAPALVIGVVAVAGVFLVTRFVPRR